MEGLDAPIKQVVLVAVTEHETGLLPIKTPFKYTFTKLAS